MEENYLNWVGSKTMKKSDSIESDSENSTESDSERVGKKWVKSKKNAREGYKSKAFDHFFYWNVQGKFTSPPVTGLMLLY